MKRILCVILVLCMVLSVVPATVFAASTVASGTCGDNLTWTLDINGVFTVSGTGAMKNYYGSNYPSWNSYNYSGAISSVVLENGVTTIGASTFYCCTALQYVSIPRSVTSIEQSAFSGCQELTSISIPDTVTNFGVSAFSGSGLASITIPSSVATIGSGAFDWCYDLTEVYFCGDAPTFGSSEAFDGVTATVYYPADNDTWTETIMNSCGGDLIWLPYEPEDTIPEETIPDDTLVDDPSKAAWIAEHIEYATSDAYQSQVVDGFPGELKNVFEDIKGDGSIGSYDALKTINKILGFDFDELSETQEYELILTQILFSFNGVTSIEETYDEYLSESAVDIIKIVLDIDEFVAGLDDDKLTQIKQTLEFLDNLADGSDEFKETLSSLLSQIDFSEKDFPKLCFNELAESGISFMAGLTSSQLETFCDTSSECIMYLAAGEAYTKTSEAFGQMLLQIRKHLAVPSDLVDLQEPLIGGEAILAMLDREVSKGIVVSNPFDIPVSITELCWAIENIYTGLEDYKITGGKAIAQKATDQYVQGTIYNVFSTGADVVISFLECVPAVKAFDAIRNLFDGTQFVIDTFTNIDDKAYHGTMVMRLYVLARLHYISLNGLAEGTEYWGVVYSADGQVLDRNKQYDDAVRFDEAVALYRAILSIALEYAKEYCSAPLFESPRTYQGYLQPISIQESKLMRQQAETNYEWCHTTYNEYAEENSLIILSTDNLAVYGLKCPITVTVTDEAGTVIARITDDLSEVMCGYEQYFYVKETHEGSGEYLKVITVPKTYNVYFEGTSNGALDAVVVDFQTGNSKFFIDIPISANTEGEFVDGSQNKELVVDSIHHTGENQTHVHTYSTPVFTWYDDYSCKATFICGDNDDTQVIDCIVVSESVYTAGAVRITYTAFAKFKGQTYETTKTEKQMGITRIAGADRIGTSLMLADQLKETLGVEKFGSVVVASALNFPDALTGSYLAAVKSAPILLTYDAVHGKIQDYIRANLAPGGMVYILGDSGVIPSSFETGFQGEIFHCMRLAGQTRFETNLEILYEAGYDKSQPVLIATAVNFADSLSASAAGLPMLLVYGSLRADQKEFLATTSKEFIIIGGTSAVSAELEAELKAIGTVERLAGAGRYQTSVMVAQKFVQNPDDVVLAYARNFPDGLCGGPLAYALGAPLILTDNYDPSAADAYVDGITAGVVAGSEGLISDASTRAIFDLAADAAITVK